MYTQRQNYNKDHSSDDQHYGFEPLEVSGLSHEDVATSCFHHDNVYVPEPCAEMASSSKRASEELPKQAVKRRFRGEWKKEFPWLRYDEEKKKMFCIICEKAKRKNPFASSGCTNFQHSTLTKHAVNNDHKAVKGSFLLC